MKLYLGLAEPLLWFIWLPLVLLGLVILLIKVKTWMTRAYAIPLYLVIAYVIPLDDVTLNSWHMAKVCPNAGLHVYRRVNVEGFIPEVILSRDILEKYPYNYLESRKDARGLVYRLERTALGFIELNDVRPKAEWEIVNHIIERADKFSGVNVERKVIRNIKSREVIAEDIHYAAFSGWIDRKISSVIDNPVGVCYSMPGLSDKYHEILIPQAGP